LRLAQQHYAALDAYILVDLIKKLAEQGAQCNQPVDVYIRGYMNDDSEEEKENNGEDWLSGSKPQYDPNHVSRAQKKHRGKKGGQNKDFIPGDSLKPTDLQECAGFVVNKSLIKLSNMINKSGVNCLVIDDP